MQIAAAARRMGAIGEVVRSAVVERRVDGWICCLLLLDFRSPNEGSMGSKGKPKTDNV